MPRNSVANGKVFASLIIGKIQILWLPEAAPTGDTFGFPRSAFFESKKKAICGSLTAPLMGDRK